MRTPVHFLSGMAIGVAALSFPVHSQDLDNPTVNSLNLKVVALVQVVEGLQKKVAALEEQQKQKGRVTAPFEVVDGAGKPLVKIEALANGRAAMTIGPSGGGVSLGVGASGAGAVLVRRADGKVGAEISEVGGRAMGLVVYDAAGAKAVAEVRADGRGNGLLSVGDAAAGGITMGIGASSNAGALLVRRADGKVGVEISQQGNRQMGVLVNDTSGAKPIAELGADGSGGGSLSISDSAAAPMFLVTENAAGRKARVSIGATEGRYGVNVYTSAGTQLASLAEARNGGGGVATFDRTGNLRAVMNGLHGEIHVVDASGATRATMVTDNGKGAFSIRSAGGTTVVRLSEGQQGGILQLANMGGNATVEAGTLPDGAGLVRAYPLGSPGAGLIGMPGTFIMGRLGQGK